MVSTITTHGIRFVWDSLDCILLNGELIGYVVEFAPLSSTKRKRVDVRNEEFTANDLNIGVDYTFQIAAVNNFGVGPFSKLMVVTAQATSKF